MNTTMPITKIKNGYYIYQDIDGNLWEAVSTSTSKKTNFDIYKNKKKQEFGAKKATDIEPTIEMLIESQREADEYIEEQGLSGWVKKGRYTEISNDFGDYVIEISPIFNYVNKRIGANLAIMKVNKDKTLTMLKLLSHYKTYSEAKKDIKRQIANL